MSNAIATWILYPLMLAKTRLQLHRKRMREADKESQDETSMLTIWEDALRREGPFGLYQGLEAQLIKGFLSQGVTMMVKQRCVIILRHATIRVTCEIVAHRVETYVVMLYLSRIRKQSV